MPIINVQYPAEALDDSRKADLAQRLTELLLQMEGNARTRGGKAFAWVMFEPIAAGNWWVAGALDGSYVAPPGKFLVHINIPEGYMNISHKAEVHAGVHAAIIAVMGDNAASGASVLTVINEIIEGDWGAAGKAISIGSIAESVGLPRDGERYAWVRSYFAAKARQYAAAGYPADTGGLLAS
jgi:phenylpyruvate tautomerase PptA (4-oxalocrotonate tautomerase family)